MILFNNFTKEQEKPMKPNNQELVLREDEEITPAHVAIVDCLLRNGQALSLKGYFIEDLPDMSSLKKTLIYLNLSFNNFKVKTKAFFEIFNKS